MRIKVILNADPGDFIDINYQYSLAAWIYRVMDKSNSGSAEFWHNSGLSFSETDNRRYIFRSSGWKEGECIFCRIIFHLFSLHI